LAFSLAKVRERMRNLIPLLAGGACFAVFGLLYNAPVSIYRLFQLRGAFLLPALLALASSLMYRNLYCRTICPFGFLQRVAGLLPLPSKRRLPPVLRSGRYILLALAVASAAMGTQLYLEPYAYLFSRRPAWWLYLFPAVVLGVSAFIPRFWCSGFCPLGAALRIGAEIRGFFLKGSPPSLGLSLESRPGAAWLALASFGCVLVSNLLLFALL
jgi:polyferredoxin